MKTFVIDTLERCLGTFCETMLASVATCSMLGDIDWVMVMSTSGLATLVCLLKCIVAKCNGDKDSASLVK